jgi:subtilisin family serine protease
MDARLPRHRSVAVAGALLTLFCAPAAAHAAGDPLLGDQWALGSGAATIDAPPAWNVSRGAGVVVAVLDSGVQLSHPELRNNLWTNPGEVPGNGLDDDHNGYTDDVHGANTLTRGGNVEDDEGHGTHVAGIVAAAAGNGVGGSGVAPNAQIMPVKVLDAQRGGDTGLLADGIRYAVDRGARILNVSINGDGSSEDLQSAVDYANSKGATIVASSGNNSRSIDLAPSYPASLPSPAILSVTASDEDGGVIAAANRGVRSVDLAAPGSMILSTARGSGFELRSGTSMAAPHVSGALALLASASPGASQGQLRDLLIASARRSSGLSGLLGGGLLDVGEAMHRLRPDAATAQTAAAGTKPRLRLKATRARAGARAKMRWSASGAASVHRWKVTLDGHKVATRAGRPKGTIRAKVSTTGRHRWKVVGLDAAGKRVVTAKAAFRVLARRG